IDFVRHWILRLVLAVSRQDPGGFRYDDFFEWAVKVNFIRKVGGGYVFFHSYLRDRFADRKPDHTLQEPDLAAKKAGATAAVLALGVLAVLLLGYFPALIM